MKRRSAELKQSRHSTRHARGRRARRMLRAPFEHLITLLHDVQITDPEWTHQIRVGTRRADVAIRVFADSLPRHGCERLQKRLRKLRHRAGAVRDLDLLQQTWLPGGEWASRVTEPATRWMQGRIQQRLAACRERFRQEARRKSVRRLQAEFRTLRRRSSLGQGDPGSWQTRLLQLLEAFTSLAAERLESSHVCHALRIAARRLRYAVELLSPFSPESPGTAIEHLVRLQSDLGDINDLATQASFVRGESETTGAPVELRRLAIEMEAAVQVELSDFTPSPALRETVAELRTWVSRFEAHAKTQPPGSALS